jgi:hypothetical protein
MPTRNYFAGVNAKNLIAATKGQDVLVSFAQVGRAKTWTWVRRFLEEGHFRYVILDSGAFTELSQRKRGKEVKIDVEAYAQFAVENQHLFQWCANLDDIEGDIVRSNKNLKFLQERGVSAVPVYHEGEPLHQLRFCLDQAHAGLGILAVGGQRPNGSLVPSNVVKMLDWLAPFTEREGLLLHGFGMTRYATDACPCREEGYPLDSVDSTTWIAEGRALVVSGAVRRRAEAFLATVRSYFGIHWAAGYDAPSFVPEGQIDEDRAIAAGSQAKTVALRLLQYRKRAEP